MLWQEIQALLSGATIMLVLGSLYAYGGIAPYFQSHLYYKGDLTISSAKLSIILVISIITTNIGIFLSGLKKLRFNYRLMALISIIGVSGSTYALSYMETLYSYLLLYGVLFGLFLGYGYLVPVRNCYDYLPEKKGLCSGVCMMGFGISPVIFTMTMTYLINPNNLSVMEDGKYPRNVAENVPESLKTVSIAYFVVGLIGVILLKPKSKQRLDQQSKKQQLNENLIELKSVQQNKKDQIISNNPKQTMIFQIEDENHELDLSIPEAPQQKAPLMIKRKYRELKEEKQILTELNEQKLSKKLFFYLFKKDLHMLVTILSLSSTFGLFLTFNYKSFGFTSIKDDAYMSLIGSLASFVSGCFRLVWGYWFDKYSFQTTTTAINSVLLIGCVIVDYAVESKASYFFVLVCVFAAFGGNYSIYPPQNVKILGKALGSRVYFVTNSGFAIGAIVQYIANVCLIDKYGRDGYTYCYIIFAGMLIMSIFYGLTIEFSTYKQQRKNGSIQNSPQIVNSN